MGMGPWGHGAMGTEQAGVWDTRSSVLRAWMYPGKELSGNRITTTDPPPCFSQTPTLNTNNNRKGIFIKVFNRCARKSKNDLGRGGRGYCPQKERRPAMGSTDQLYKTTWLLSYNHEVTSVYEPFSKDARSLTRSRLQT